MAKLIAAALMCLTLAAGQVPPPPAPPKGVQDDFTVVFGFKPKNAGDPVCRIYLMVKGRSEGEAAIRAQRYLSERIAIGAMEDLEYLEANLKR